mgnify:CR=1 FL=1
MFGKRKKAQAQPEEKQPSFEDKPKIGAKDSGPLSAVQSNIETARSALMKFDLETAKRVYTEAMRAYSILSAEDKSKVYNDLKELYFERKSAERVKA